MILILFTLIQKYLENWRQVLTGDTRRPRQPARPARQPMRCDTCHAPITSSTEFRQHIEQGRHQEER